MIVDEQQQPPSLAIPLLIGLAAFVLMLGFQTSQIISQRSAIAATREGQNGPMDESSKVRRQLDALAQSTAGLAEKGNANAQAVIANLARQGVQIHPPAKQPDGKQPDAK